MITWIIWINGNKKNKMTFKHLECIWKHFNSCLNNNSLEFILVQVENRSEIRTRHQSKFTFKMIDKVWWIQKDIDILISWKVYRTHNKIFLNSCITHKSHANIFSNLTMKDILMNILIKISNSQTLSFLLFRNPLAITCLSINGKELHRSFKIPNLWNKLFNLLTFYKDKLVTVIF